MKDIPNVLYINLVDPPARVVFDQNGDGIVQLPGPDGIVGVSEFRRLSLLVGPTKASSSMIQLGQISGSTLSEGLIRPNDGKIQTVEVTAPELGLALVGGPPNTEENVQIWVFLQS